MRLWDMTLSVDTHGVFEELSGDGGFSESQARLITNVVRKIDARNTEKVATKQDLNHLEDKMMAEFELVRQEFRSEMASLEQRLTIKLGGMMLVGLGVIVALQQLIGGRSRFGAYNRSRISRSFLRSGTLYWTFLSRLGGIIILG
ncbi:MAG: hypothetical protein AAFP90_01115 [Planctomycetota bacterium]